MAAEEDVRHASTRGRPRSQAARRAVLEATLALVREGGYPAATIEEISTRSGVAKTTIYRWWPNRPCLVVELLLEMAATIAPPPAGPDPIRALRTELSRVAKATNALPGRLMLALIGEAQNDPEVRSALAQGLFKPRRAATAKVIRQAQASGTIRKSVSPGVVVDLLFGPVFYRGFVRQEPVTQEFVKLIFQNAMKGLGPGSRARRRRTRRRG